MRLLRPVAVLVFAAALAAADAPAIPANVTKDVEAFRARIDKINADADKKRTDELIRIRKTLDDQVTAETRKGNLDLALAIRKLKDELQAPASAGDGDLLAPQAAPAVPAAPAMTTLVLGKWRMGMGSVWTVKPDGVFTRTRGPGGMELPGTWKVVDGKILLIYQDGREHLVVRVDQRQMVISKDEHEFICERIE